MVALAMLEAKSVDPVTFAPYIPKLLAGSSGAVPVGSFADGKSALAAGKQIQYVGLVGPWQMDRWHNDLSNFDIDRFDSSGNLVKLGSISAAQIQAATP